MKPVLLPLALLALAGSVLPAQAAVPAVLDTGMYRIYRNEHSLGTERFSFQTLGDSLVVASFVQELLPGRSGPDTLSKTMGMVLKAEDFDLRSYESHQRFQGQRLHRGLVMDDTVMTSYIHVNDHGNGDRVVRPPGRLFVIDPQVFALYDVICRNLHDRTFDRREVVLYFLGASDTTIIATVTDLGQEAIRWASRSVQARKLSMTEGKNEYLLWISPKGYMIRLAQPALGIRIERAAPAVKRTATSRLRSGG